MSQGNDPDAFNVYRLSRQEGYYAMVRWSAEDIQRAAHEIGYTVTPAEAEEWLQRNEEALQDRLVQDGFQIIKDLIRFGEANESADGGGNW